MDTCDNDSLYNQHANSFKKIIKTLSFKNRFEVSLIPPKSMGAVTSLESEMLYYLRSASVPSVQLEINETFHGGQKRRAVIKNTVDTIMLELFDTKKLEFHGQFVKWIDNIFTESGHLKYYPDDVVSDIHIKNYGKKLYEIKRVMPTSVGDVRLSHDESDIVSFDVTFNIERLKVL